MPKSQKIITTTGRITIGRTISAQKIRGRILSRVNFTGSAVWFIVSLVVVAEKIIEIKPPKCF